jgi:hypothetical protein
MFIRTKLLERGIRLLQGCVAAIALSFVLRVAPAVSESAGPGQPDGCGLYLRDSAVCYYGPRDQGCVGLHGDKAKIAAIFRCLVRNITVIDKCDFVFISANTFVLLHPVKVSRTAMLYKGISDNEFFSEEQIVNSCHPR